MVPIGRSLDGGPSPAARLAPGPQSSDGVPPPSSSSSWPPWPAPPACVVGGPPVGSEPCPVPPEAEGWEPVEGGDALELGRPPGGWAPKGFDAKTAAAKTTSPTRTRIECNESLLWSRTGGGSFKALHGRIGRPACDRSWCENLQSRSPPRPLSAGDERPSGRTVGPPPDSHAPATGGGTGRSWSSDGHDATVTPSSGRTRSRWRPRSRDLPLSRAWRSGRPSRVRSWRS